MNRTPSPLMASLRQEAARQGYFILIEGSRPLQKLLAELWREKESRTAQHLLNAAEMIRQRTVRLQPGLAHQQRVERATPRLRILEERTSSSRCPAPGNSSMPPSRRPRRHLQTPPSSSASPCALPADWASIQRHIST